LKRNLPSTNVNPSKNDLSVRKNTIEKQISMPKKQNETIKLSLQYNRASFSCSKKFKELHLFLTKVVKSCIYAKAF